MLIKNPIAWRWGQNIRCIFHVKIHSICCLLCYVTWASKHRKSVATWMLDPHLVPADEKRKIKAAYYWALVSVIHLGLVDSPHRGPVMRNAFPFHYIIMVHYHACDILSFQLIFWVCVVLVLNVIRCSCHYFLDRILFHHDFHNGSCDYHWDFYGH